ncbi:MAG: tetratricopeptide repeat protein [Janthinobacterium lividum]
MAQTFAQKTKAAITQAGVKPVRGRGRRVLSILLLASLICAVAKLCHRFPSTPVFASNAAEAIQVPPPLHRPDAVCANCHAAIYKSYEQTTMARGSGLATEGLIPGDFTHEQSGVTYRIYARNGRTWMSFTRPSSSSADALSGERELLYFVGSGTHGRTYLYQAAGEWFELPVNFYGRRVRWGMAPAYDAVTSMPAPLPVDANCMHCHASEVETSVPEAHNRFPKRPFDEAGIGCSACHGDPTQHLAAHGHGPIVNPDKLSVVARDSACIQCHLEGNATVYKPGRSLEAFRAGDTLSDFAVYFVRASEAEGGRRASSQYEALLQSACKRASGDSLTCTTCHDPHRDPAPSERVAFYRARCLNCHTSPALAAKHHPEQPDCALCHMPSRSTVDISHEQVTDHNIQRVPRIAVPGSVARSAAQPLVPVGNVPVSDRELGLAYAQLAEKGDTLALERALRLLMQAEKAGATDEQVHVNLGFLDQRTGNIGAARQEYAAALRENPYNPTALTNRAILDASTGELDEAVRLLDRLVRADPSQIQAGIDLAFLECRAGETSASRALGERLQELNPDSPELRTFLASGTVGGRNCRPAGVTNGQVPLGQR